MRRLVNQVSHWTPGRWSRTVPGVGAGAGGSATCADLVHGLVQRLADWAADQEGQPRRPVPRLDSDLALPDQLRVVANDLVAAAPPEDVRAAAVAAVNEVRQALG
ncbi:MAG: hypothetical protein IRZ05_10475 [Micromonosporaceae bacterium]|nr:hypothetical protein [Micromonosporaceae bacterium]